MRLRKHDMPAWMVHRLLCLWAKLRRVRHIRREKEKKALGAYRDACEGSDEAAIEVAWVAYAMATKAVGSVPVSVRVMHSSIGVQGDVP